MIIRASAVLTFAIFLIAFVSFEARAVVESREVITVRGIKLEITIEKPFKTKTATPVLIFAPGQACHAPNEELDQAAVRARDAGYSTVRFEWAYCQNDPLSLPSPFLVDEMDDLETALSYVRGNSEFDQNHIVIAGKTQGSFVAYRVFVRQPLVQALALLTPVCTYTVDNENQPLPTPIMVGHENYPYLALQRRPILILAGSQDKSCLLSALDELLVEASPNVEKRIVNGDHAFRVFNRDGKLDETATFRNHQAAASALTTWLTRITKIGT